MPVSPVPVSRRRHRSTWCSNCAPDFGPCPDDYHEVVGIRVVIAEDNFLLRDGVSRLLRAVDDIDVVGVAGDLDELLAAVDEYAPDVVLTDIRMPPTGTDEGIRAAAEIRRRSPSTGVVVLSQHAKRPTRWRCSTKDPTAAPTC